MKALRNKTLKYFVTLTFCLSLFMVSSVDAGDCDFQEVYNDCVDTAQQNWEDGVIDYETYQEFEDVHCPAAATSCLEEA